MAAALCVAVSLFGPAGETAMSAGAALTPGGRAASTVGTWPARLPRPNQERTKAPVSATPIPPAVPTITWPIPAAITYGTPLDGRQLDASVTFTGIIVPGLITYTPASGTILHAGTNQELLAGFVPSVQNFVGATGSVLITVNPAPTTLSLTVSPPAPAADGPVTLTAVISTTATGVSAPVGDVTFYDGSSALGLPVALVSGSAQITAPHLTAGTHSLNARFTAVANSLGNADFAPSQAAAAVGAGQSATQVTLSATNSTSYIGQIVGLSARVAGLGSGTPTGTVTFFDTIGAAPRLLGSGPLDGGGYARLAETALALGAHRVVAVYGGDAGNQGGQSVVLIQVVRSCTVSAHVLLRNTVVLDALVGAQAIVGAHLTFGAGKAQVRIGSASVTYCANPGRSNGQATVSGTIAGAGGRLKKGDQVMVTLRMTGVSRAPDAVLVDVTVKQRLSVSGPYDKGSALSISTP